MQEDLDPHVALLNRLSERRLRQATNPNVQHIRSRKEIEQALLETFDLVGGIPRLALWANEPENYGEFLKLLLKLAPKEQVGKIQGQIIEYRSNIGASRIGQRPQEEEEIVDFPE